MTLRPGPQGTQLLSLSLEALCWSPELPAHSLPEGCHAVRKPLAHKQRSQGGAPRPDEGRALASPPPAAPVPPPQLPRPLPSFPDTPPTAPGPLLQLPRPLPQLPRGPSSRPPAPAAPLAMACSLRHTHSQSSQNLDPQKQSQKDIK